MLLYYNFVFNKDVSNYQMKNITKDELNTGDIFLIDFQNINNFFITSLFKENFMHPAIVLKEEDETYIIDYIARKKLVKRTLAEWKAYNKRSVYILNKLDCDDEKRKTLTNKLKELYDEHKDILSGPSGFSLDWKRFWWPSDYYQEPNDLNNLVCMELIVYFLMKMGIIETNKSIESFLPRDFENMKGFKSKDNFSFKESFLVNSIFF